MSETKAATPKDQAAKARPVGAAPRSFGVRLVGEAGDSMWLRAYATKAGWRTEAVHRVGKKNTRGASAEHATLELARAAVEALARAAEKAGWARRERRGGGFVRRPDAFTAAGLEAGQAREEVAGGHDAGRSYRGWRSCVRGLARL